MLDMSATFDIIDHTIFKPLGPLEYSIFTHRVGKIILNIGCHIYADDMQMYVICDPKMSGACNALWKLQNRIKQIKDWMLVFK